MGRSPLPPPPQKPKKKNSLDNRVDREIYSVYYSEIYIVQAFIAIITKSKFNSQ